MNNKLFVSSSPHIKSRNSVQKIMLHVIISLIPAIIASGIIFGPRAILVIISTVISCVLSEHIFRRILKRNNTISDLSAVVTGIILALNLPVNIKLWMAIFGAIVAIVVVKQMFGGLGQNFVNPAACARIILAASFPKIMTTFAEPFSYKNSFDAVTTATPLAKMHSQPLQNILSYKDAFFGNYSGCLGETCSFALILGAVYLLIFKVIKPTIPIVYILTVATLTGLMGYNPILEILTGGLLLGAIFMATDYVTNPMTFKGQLIFAFGCGLITSLIRVFGSLPEGVSFAIIIMNILSPTIDKLTLPKTFGSRV